MWWTQKDNLWFASDQVNKHFRIKYTLYANEDGIWGGSFEQWTMNPNKDSDIEYYSFELHDVGIAIPRTPDLERLKLAVADFHISKAWPALVKLHEEYSA